MDNGRAPRLAQLLRPALGQGDTYQALALGLRSLVLDGQLVVGARVASERDLARELTLSRATVTAAYGRLRAEGFLRSDRGGGTRVHVPGTHPTRPDEALAAAEDVIDLTIAALPAPGLLLEVVAEATGMLPSVLAGHGLHPFGLDQLRRTIAGHQAARGLPTRPEQILITQGALHGWDLVLRAFVRPGDRVLVEQPTYPAVLDAARAHHARQLPLGVTDDGWDTGATGAGRGTVAPVLAHVTAEYQNPTGLRLPTA
ncbi:MAG TPA: aminotransferase class I/II-fold pyridoxal phosphate-dependent enzyme, partial [Mycobacteriales bacterium]|nr:aminotransferase class I/II-fold pyridoxal phosphate-dependent enzyme [Mycobacteriales bacterium]